MPNKKHRCFGCLWFICATLKSLHSANQKRKIFPWPAWPRKRRSTRKPSLSRERCMDCAAIRPCATVLAYKNWPDTSWDEVNGDSQSSVKLFRNIWNWTFTAFDIEFFVFDVIWFYIRTLISCQWLKEVSWNMETKWNNYRPTWIDIKHGILNYSHVLKDKPDPNIKVITVN